MKKISLNSDDCFEAVQLALAGGGLVLHPTETCYGLAVDVFNKEALEKLYLVKQMDLAKPVSILVDGLGMAQEFGIFSDKALELAQKYWPGPLSILVPRKKTLPDFLNPGSEFVSLRFSSDTFCQRIVADLGRPVSTTSANISGQPQMYEVEDLAGVDLAVDGGKITVNKPSTIVKVKGDFVEVLRQGDLIVGL